MYPYLELFGTKIYMTGIGIVVACLSFIGVVYYLCRKYHQEFMRFFNWLPWLLISVYVLGLYVDFVLSSGSFIPTSWSVFSPYGYHFSLIGVVLASFVSVLFFIHQFRRIETKKVWIDIIFFGFIDAIVVLGVFLVLGDNFIGKSYTGVLHVSALMEDSALVKYGGVYPLGLFLSIGALAINVIISIWKMFAKRSGLGLWGFILLFILLIILLPFWNYPAHGVIALMGKYSLDVNHYVLIFLILYCLVWNRTLRNPY